MQQPFTLPTHSVQWEVQWTLCCVGATDLMVAVRNTVIYLVMCRLTARYCSSQMTDCVEHTAYEAGTSSASDKILHTL